MPAPDPGRPGPGPAARLTVPDATALRGGYPLGDVSQSPPPWGEPTTPNSPPASENWTAPAEPGPQLSTEPVYGTWDPGPVVPAYEPVRAVSPAPQPYTAPVYAPYSAQTNGMAIASLIFGIASWFVFPFIAAILAIIFGHVARGQIRRQGEQGGAMAIIGLILGYLNLALSMFGIVVLILFIIGVAAIASSS